MSSVTFQVAHAFGDASPFDEPQPGVGSSVSNVIEFPVRRKYDGQLESDVVLPLPTDDEVASAIIRLARRNEALEDFAALVAHELKTPLQAALLADDPSGPVEDALQLVETLLAAAQGEGAESVFSSVAESLDLAVEDLHAEVEVTTDLATRLPLPPEPLRVILRNLLANAAAAGADHVHVAAARSSRSWRLLVDDDGAGLADTDSYAAGSGLGLSLCRRIAARFGGVLELAPRPSGGTRATLDFAGAV